MAVVLSSQADSCLSAAAVAALPEKEQAGATPTPAKPWMGFQNYGWPWKDNDFFQELWLQLAASGVGQFYYLCAVCPPHWLSVMPACCLG